MQRRESPDHLTTKVSYLIETLAAEKTELDLLCQKKNRMRRMNFFYAHELKGDREILEMQRKVEEMSSVCDEWQDSIEIVSYENEMLGVKILNLGSEIRSLSRKRKDDKCIRHHNRG
mmetsp:Transcript_216/g.310  ORF Transcript_216/g.310 Transcript_216/m.310 type:complete len:117 (-) Transcript_216:36-386(-)